MFPIFREMFPTFRGNVPYFGEKCSLFFELIHRKSLCFNRFGGLYTIISININSSINQGRIDRLRFGGCSARRFRLYPERGMVYHADGGEYQRNKTTKGRKHFVYLNGMLFLSKWKKPFLNPLGRVLAVGQSIYPLTPQNAKFSHFWACTAKFLNFSQVQTFR